MAFTGKAPPDAKRCLAIVKDPRSKRVGERCRAWRVSGHELCNGHLGIAQAAAKQNAEDRKMRVIADTLPEDVREREHGLLVEEALRRQEERAHAREEKMPVEVVVPPKIVPTRPLTDDEQADIRESRRTGFPSPLNQRDPPYDVVAEWIRSRQQANEDSRDSWVEAHRGSRVNAPVPFPELDGVEPQIAARMFQGATPTPERMREANDRAMEDWKVGGGKVTRERFEDMPGGDDGSFTTLVVETGGPTLPFPNVWPRFPEDSPFAKKGDTQTQQQRYAALNPFSSAGRAEREAYRRRNPGWGRS